MPNRGIPKYDFVTFQGFSILHFGRYILASRVLALAATKHPQSPAERGSGDSGAPKETVNRIFCEQKHKQASPPKTLGNLHNLSPPGGKNNTTNNPAVIDSRSNQQGEQNILSEWKERRSFGTGKTQSTKGHVVGFGFLSVCL